MMAREKDLLKSDDRGSIKLYENSLDFIGILAALDVMIAHTSVYVMGNGSGASIPFWKIIAPGPAVVVFFSISGFLTMASFEHSKNIIKYYIKRVVRIYPALLVAIILPIIIYALSGLVEIEPINFFKFIIKKLITGRGSGYNPEGAIGNGSLWTVFIQIQFYILTPLLFYFINRVKKKFHIWIVFALIVLNLASPTMSIILPSVLNNLYQNNCIPYLYMYVLGSILYIDRDVIIPLLTEKRVLICLSGLYILWHWVLGADFWIKWTYINPISGVIVSILCIGFGFALGTHRAKIDFSYGLFLWHLPIMDILHTVIGIKYSLNMLILTWLISIIMAILSYVLIERPIVKKAREILK